MLYVEQGLSEVNLGGLFEQVNWRNTLFQASEVLHSLQPIRLTTARRISKVSLQDQLPVTFGSQIFSKA